MTDVPDSFAVPIREVQPSQLLLNSEKLAAVVERFDFNEPNYGVLPVREIDGKWVLTDGHTRAFCATLGGADELRLHEDPDELPMGLYRVCMRWCEEEGVTWIGDLSGRVVGEETFREQWIKRCRRAAERIGDEPSGRTS